MQSFNSKVTIDNMLPFYLSLVVMPCTFNILRAWRSDGEDELTWFGLPAVASQDLSFKGESRAVPVGQQLEVP